MSEVSVRRSVIQGPLFVAASAVVLVAGATLPASAGVAPSYVVPAGVEVIEVVVLGARGGNAGSDVFQQGGAGCRVTASLTVEAGDELTWLSGSPGDNTTFGASDQSGGAGGAGTRPGGDGGATVSVSGNGTPGAGGGGASSLSLNDEEQIVAGGGGGGTGTTGGGSGCASSSPAGGQGFGSSPVAGGGITPDVGGIAGLGNGGSANPPPGTAGNGASEFPEGKGGTGGEGRFNGPGGGGGGGGISGGGGGAGQSSQFGGGNGTGAAGLSGAPDAPSGVAAPRFAEGERGSGSVAVREVEIATSSLPSGTSGTSYSATLEASLMEQSDAPGVFLSVVTPANGETFTWSVADGSDPLPAGLTLDSSGSITGTPSASGTAEVTLAASVLDGAGDVRARSVVGLTLEVAGGATTTTEATTTTTTTTAESSTTTSTAASGAGGASGTGGGSGSLPATGVSGVAPLLATGLVLMGSGAGAALLARRRTRS